MLSTIKDKVELRKAAKAAVKSIETEQKQLRSALIFKNILNLDSVKCAQTVALYASLPDEVASMEAVEALAQQKRVVLPRVAGDSMEFYDYHSEQMSCGAFGISEPQGEQAVEPSDIDVIIVPGVVFTRSGQRIGRGKGYYDKYLSRANFRATKIGVCYSEQIAEQIDVEPHDIVMDCVVCG